MHLPWGTTRTRPTTSGALRSTPCRRGPCAQRAATSASLAWLMTACCRRVGPHTGIPCLHDALLTSSCSRKLYYMAIAHFRFSSTYALLITPDARCASHTASQQANTCGTAQAMHLAISVLYNASGYAACYNASQLEGPAGPGATWLYQWCTQRSAQELPYFPANGAAEFGVR